MTEERLAQIDLESLASSHQYLPSPVLGIDNIPDKLKDLVKGYRNPNDYFSLFRKSELVHKDSHIWFHNVANS